MPAITIPAKPFKAAYLFTGDTYRLSCIHIERYPEAVVISSTDSHQLYMYCSDSILKAPVTCDHTSIDIDPKNVLTLIKASTVALDLVWDDNDTTVNVTAHTSKNVITSTVAPIHDGKYSNYRRLIPSDYQDGRAVVLCSNLERIGKAGSLVFGNLACVESKYGKTKYSPVLYTITGAPEDPAFIDVVTMPVEYKTRY